jgi:N-methylhydantoinase A
MARNFIPYTVYDRYKLFPRAKFRGPAIIEEKESTVIVGEDASVSMDDFGFLWIDLSAGQKPVTKTRMPAKKKSSSG